eukprot:4480767-Pyramimonas_sp.AAC.2
MVDRWWRDGGERRAERAWACDVGAQTAAVSAGEKALVHAAAKEKSALAEAARAHAQEAKKAREAMLLNMHKVCLRPHPPRPPWAALEGPGRVTSRSRRSADVPACARCSRTHLACALPSALRHAAQRSGKSQSRRRQLPVLSYRQQRED